MPALAVGDRVEKWIVEGLLGEGGMASVYRVRHAQLGTVRALKVLEQRSRSIQERLKREGRVQAQLRHPNIVAVHDLVELDGACALLMELVPGPPLNVLLRRQRLTLVQADMLARRILSAVGYAHQQGLVHRDLKPANVLVEAVGDVLVPRVADFGLAKLVLEDDGGTKTRSGVAMGTPLYMPPEQIRNAKSVDARADVYSLGILLYELVTGRRPFQGDDLVDLYTAAQEGRYVRVSTHEPGLPVRMVTAIEAAMAPDRERRPVDAGALLLLWTDGAEEPERHGVAAELWSPLLELTRALAAAPTIVAPFDDEDDGEGARSGTMASFASDPPREAVVPHERTAATGDASSAPVAPSPAPSGPSRSLAVMAGAAGASVVGTAALVVVVLVLLVAWWATRPPATAVVATPPVPAPIAAAPAPIPVAPVPDPPTPTPTPPPTPRAAPTPAPTPTPVPLTPAPLEPPSPASDPALATIRVSGVERVRLLARGTPGSFAAPGQVPPGTYDVHAFFETTRADPAGRITVVAGEQRSLVCNKELLTCR